MMRLAEKLTVQTFIKGFQTLKKEGVSAFYTKLGRLSITING